MKNKFRNKKLILIVFISFLIGIYLATYFPSIKTDVDSGSTSSIEHHSPPSVIIEPGSAVETASYIIFHDDETPKNYYAKNGNTGEIEFSGADASTVIQSALDGLTTGRTWKETVLCKGNFIIDDTILIPSYTRMVTYGQFTLASGTNKNMIQNSDQTTLQTDIEIEGGIFYANEAGQTSGYIGVAYFKKVSRLRIHNTKMYGARFWGLRLNGVNESWIGENVIKGGAWGEGIILKSMAGFESNWNTFEANEVWGSYTSAHCALLFEYSGYEIPDNKILHNTLTVPYTTGANPTVVRIFTGSNRTICQGNHIFAPANCTGIQVAGSWDCEFSDNVIIGIGDHHQAPIYGMGMGLEGGGNHGHLWSNNFIYNFANGLDPELSEDMIITNNHIEFCSLGIEASGWINAARRTSHVIDGNYIKNSLVVGISLWNERNDIVSNNVIVDKRTTSEMDYGISISGDSATQHGFDLTIVGNIISRAEKGIRVRWVNSSRIADNTIESCTYGIYIESGAETCVIEHNSLINSITAAIDNSGVNMAFRHNEGYNPVGYIVNPITGGNLVDSGSGSIANNVLYTCWESPKAIYINGGTVSSVQVEGQEVFTTTNVMVVLQPSDTFRIVWSSAPTIRVIGQ